jgi:uncharacterized OB-fold protein
MPNTTNAEPEVKGLFVSSGEGDQVRLVLGKCTECAATFFPKHAELHKPGCSGGTVDELLLSPYGTLVSYTVQHYQPPWPYPVPEKWEPVGIGTAIFDEGLQIPAQITGWDLDKLAVGLRVEVVSAVLDNADGGDEQQTWKFRPTAQDEGKK